jgi:hypothetical protein
VRGGSEQERERDGHQHERRDLLAGADEPALEELVVDLEGQDEHGERPSERR